MATSVALTIPAGKVASTLTDFVTRVDLSDMPSSWWADTTADLGNVRVRQAGVDVPIDLVDFDRAAETGELFFKATLTTGDNDFTVETVDGATALVVTDPNGRNAVWADYDAMFVLSSLTNRTGSGIDAAIVGTATTTSDGLDSGTGGTSGGGGGYAKVVGLPKRTQWTMGATGHLTEISNNRCLLGYSANDSNIANEAVLVADFDASGNRYGIWNSGGSWLYDTSVPAAAGDTYRLHHTQNGTTDRKIWRDGTARATDLGTVQRPASTGDTLFIGTENTAAAQTWRGQVNYAYLRNGVLSADWLAAETLSWESPSSFYATGAATITLTETLPALVDSMTIRSYTPTDTSNGRSGRIRGGYAIHADNTDPVTLPAAAATRRDKALWYPDPELVDGRPVSPVPEPEPEPSAVIPQTIPFTIGA